MEYLLHELIINRSVAFTVGDLSRTQMRNLVTPSVQSTDDNRYLDTPDMSTYL